VHVGVQLFLVMHIYIIFIISMPLSIVPSAVEPPVLLLRDVREAILKALQYLFAHILK
jgi:hypothetical protein